MKTLLSNFIPVAALIWAVSLTTQAQDYQDVSYDTCPLNRIEYKIGEKVSIEIGDDIKYFECVMSVHPVKQKNMEWVVDSQWPVWTPIKPSEDIIINWF